MNASRGDNGSKRTGCLPEISHGGAKAKIGSVYEVKLAGKGGAESRFIQTPESLAARHA